jgi:hypothetical protein
MLAPRDRAVVSPWGEARRFLGDSFEAVSAGAVTPIEVGELKAWADRDTSGLALRLVGNADLRAAQAFGAFIREAEAAAVAAGLREVTIDVRELEFMNAVCLREVAAWVSRLQALPPDTRYRLRFVTDPGRHWQRLSLPMLKCFGTELVELVE